MGLRVAQAREAHVTEIRMREVWYRAVATGLGLTNAGGRSNTMHPGQHGRSESRLETLKGRTASVSRCVSQYEVEQGRRTRTAEQHRERSSPYGSLRIPSLFALTDPSTALPELLRSCAAHNANADASADANANVKYSV